MKTLSLAKAVEFYLEQRRRLGFALKEDGQMLRQLVRYAAQQHHRGPLTTMLAMAWAQSPAQASRRWWARRLETVRRFATFWRTFDPRTEIPPAGALGSAYGRRAVHLYTIQEIVEIMHVARQLGGLRGLSFCTLIGLLACTGLRIGEALRLQRKDIDWATGSLNIRHSKGGRSRCVPLHASSLHSLQHYLRRRQSYRWRVDREVFFLGKNGHAISYAQAAYTFRHLCNDLGWRHQPVPRLHDLRHTFAVNTLIECYRRGDDVGRKVHSLATYLGHTSIRGTYWYLSTVPQLLTLAQACWPDLTPKKGGAHA